MSIEFVKSETTYNISLDALKRIIANELEVDVKNVNVEYVLEDVRDAGSQYPRYELYKVVATIRENAPV